MDKATIVRIDRALIERLLADASTTRDVVVERGALANTGHLIAQKFPHRPATIVADERTWEIAGQAVYASLKAAGHPVTEPIIFPGTPELRPDYSRVEYLKGLIAAPGAGDVQPVPIAVGSGTINDLTKRAADEVGLPYAVVATAASMDGYTASGASLIHQGVKQTFTCTAPVLVIADLDILCAAPSPMTASGYGDLVGKVTAGADWLLADALGIEPLIPEVWEMVQGPLRGVIARPERLVSGDADAIEQIFLGLVATGLAIQVAGSTRPASGSEHQFSHVWEMRGLEYEGRFVSHGFKVGLGTIVSAAFYEEMMQHAHLERLDVESAVARYPTLDEIERAVHQAHTNPLVAEKAIAECRAKHVSADELRSRLTTLREKWPILSKRLHEQLLTTNELRDLLAGAGCPTTPEEIGLDRRQLQESYAAAQQIRRRYTIFDLGVEIGQFDHLVDALFTPDGYWGSVA
ncbi:MAG: sn-glycerol-1-phosphate dehydrogenase [Thermomicrobiales bacterium]